MKSGLLNNNQNYINRWVVSYADFVTMLLALFMVLYALSQLDISHMKTFSNSLGRAFEGNSKKNTTNSVEKSRLLKSFKTTKINIYTEQESFQTQANSSKELKKQLSSFGNKINSESANFEEIKKTIKNEFNDTKNVNKRIGFESNNILQKFIFYVKHTKV